VVLLQPDVEVVPHGPQKVFREGHGIFQLGIIFRIQHHLQGLLRFLPEGGLKVPGAPAFQENLHPGACGQVRQVGVIGPGDTGNEAEVFSLRPSYTIL
jgi:hypothetical protein